MNNRKSSLGMSLNLVYVLISLLPLAGSLLFLIFDFKDREIRLHALQTLYVAIAIVLVHIILGLLASIPFIGAFFSVIIWVMYILYVFVMLVGLIKALNGSILTIPFFYEMAYKGSY